MHSTCALKRRKYAIWIMVFSPTWRSKWSMPMPIARPSARTKAKLSMPVAEELLQHLYREKFVEIRGLISFGNNRYGMLDRGWQRAQQLLEMNGYIGPAPVSLPAYTEMMIAKARHATRSSPRLFPRPFRA